MLEALVSLGDSSVYTNRPHKKRTWVPAELDYLLPGKLEVQCLPGGGINEFNTALRKNMLQGKVVETLGQHVKCCAMTLHLPVMACDRPLCRLESHPM